jgi:hypothetical protein
MIISEGKVWMDPVKIQGITNWPTPKSQKDVQAFLGFCNFYCRFVRDYAKIACPLHPLTGNTPFKWTGNCNKAFNQLKSLITNSPNLAINNDNPFHLETDASDYANGTVLSQRQNTQWKLIAFLSKVLNSTQQNYEIYDKELLAIMLALQEFWQYLIDTKEVF